MNPAQNKSLNSDQNNPQTVSPQNSLSTDKPDAINKYWKRAICFFLIASVLVLLLGGFMWLGGGAGGAMASFVLIMVDLFVMYVVFLGWLIATIWQHFSKDKSTRKKIKLMTITIAIIILPGWVILPILAGITDHISQNSAKSNYRKCMDQNTKLGAPVVDAWSSKNKLNTYRDYYKMCEDLRPQGYHYYPKKQLK